MPKRREAIGSAKDDAEGNRDMMYWIMDIAKGGPQTVKICKYVMFPRASRALYLAINRFTINALSIISANRVIFLLRFP